MRLATRMDRGAEGCARPAGPDSGWGSVGWLLLGLVALAERALLPWHVSMARDRGAR